MSNFKTYTCRYYHEGSWWALDIEAQDQADAEARVAKLGNLQLLGEVKMRLRADTPAAAPLIRLLVWVRNALKSETN